MISAKHWENTIEDIEEVSAHFRENKLPNLWWIGPRAQPANLDVYLSLFFSMTSEFISMVLNIFYYY